MNEGGMVRVDTQVVSCKRFLVHGIIARSNDDGMNARSPARPGLLPLPASFLNREGDVTCEKQQQESINSFKNLSLPL
jgi:hypothetical protein